MKPDLTREALFVRRADDRRLASTICVAPASRGDLSAAMSPARRGQRLIYPALLNDS